MMTSWTDSAGTTHVIETADCGDFPECHAEPPTCGHAPSRRVTLALDEADLSLVLDALLAFERATDEEGRLVATDEDHVDYGDPEALDRLAARVDHATDLARQVGSALDVMRARA